MTKGERDILKALSGLLPEGYAIVPLEPTPEAVGAWHKVKNGHHFHDEPAPTDTSCYAAYRALVASATIGCDREGPVSDGIPSDMLQELEDKISASRAAGIIETSCRVVDF